MESIPIATDVVEAPPAGVDARIRRFRAGQEVDTFAVICERLVVIVDTHSTPALMQRELVLLTRDLATRPALVFLTHADYDHAWGTEALPGVPIVGHRLCHERLAGDLGPSDLAAMRAEQPGRFDDLTLIPPTIVFDDGITIDGGDLTLVAIPTPGHCADHVSLWIPEIATLLPGDAAEQPFPHVTTRADIDTAVASLDRLAALDPAIVLPCHGDTTDAAILDRNRAYFAAVLADPDITYEDAVRAAGSDPATTSGFYRSFHDDACRAARG